MKCYVHQDVEGVGTCTNCGKVVCPACAMEVNGKIVCKSCAEKMANQPLPVQVVNKKEPMLALLLSLIGGFLTAGLLLGLGQIYNGQFKKGISILLTPCFHVGDHHCHICGHKHSDTGSRFHLRPADIATPAGILAMGHVRCIYSRRQDQQWRARQRLARLNFFRSLHL